MVERETDVWKVVFSLKPMISLEDIKEAHKNISSYVHKTPQIFSNALNHTQFKYNTYTKIQALLFAV